MTFALLVVSAGLSPSTGADAAEPIRIGAVLPFSGGVELYGQQAKLGLDLAVKDINAAGGILGRPVEVIYTDDKTRPASAAAAAHELIERDGVVAVDRAGRVKPENAAALRHQLRGRQMQPICFRVQHGSEPGAGPIAALYESNLWQQLFPARCRPGLAAPDVRYCRAPD
jgi:hypothetical protein